MTTAKVKAQERASFSEMVRLLQLDLDGEPVERERPDFMFKLCDGRTIGVELVRALDEYIAGGRGARARIKARLAKMLDGLSAFVNVRVNEHTLGALNRDAKALNAEIGVVAALARKAVAAGIPERGGRHYEWIDHELIEMGIRQPPDEYTHDLDGTGAQHVDCISIYPASELIVSWSSFGGGQRARVVQEVIDEKNENIEAYRECGADELWLLVIGSAGTGGALFVEEVEGKQFCSVFDRTLFLELFEGRCVPLDTIPPAPAAQ